MKRIHRMKLLLILVALTLLHGPTAATEADEEPALQQGSSAKTPPAVDWRARIAAATPAPGETLYVVVHSALDCQYCREWKSSKKGAALATLIANGRPDVRVVVIERDSLRGHEESGAYPPELRFEYERRLRRHQLAPTVPAFEIFLRGSLVYRTSGLSMWNSNVIPAVLEIEQRRDDGQKAAPPARPASAS